MLRDLRRLLLALTLALTGVVLVQVPAHACKCVSSDVSGDIERADLVFTGTVTASSRVDDGRRQATRYRVAAETVYQGELMSSNVVVVSPGTSCGLSGLETDEQYLWFVKEKAGDLTANQCGGTDRATDRLVRQVEEVLGEGEPLDGPPPADQAPAEFTPVADAEPRPLTRIAAPGVALVLIGLLGLFVVRRRTRAD